MSLMIPFFIFSSYPIDFFIYYQKTTPVKILQCVSCALPPFCGSCQTIKPHILPLPSVSMFARQIIFLSGSISKCLVSWSVNFCQIQPFLYPRTLTWSLSSLRIPTWLPSAKVPNTILPNMLYFAHCPVMDSKLSDCLPSLFSKSAPHKSHRYSTNNYTNGLAKCEFSIPLYNQWLSLLGKHYT